MPDQSEISTQKQLLEAYRSNLAHLLRQAAQYGGETYAPLSVSNMIYQSRKDIQRIKAILREQQVFVTDSPEDDSITSTIITDTGNIAIGQRNISTGGGDYVEGNIDKRSNVFVTGGTISGPVVGVNSGNITINNPSVASLEDVLMKVRELVTTARENSNDDLADDLEGIELLLRAALKAEFEGRVDRKNSKLVEVQQSLRKIAVNQLEVQPLIQIVDRIT